MNSSQYIDKVKKVMDLDTDYKVSKMLGWKQNKISQYRKGQGMDNDAARQIAEILNIPVWGVIADMEAARQKDPDKVEAWEKLSRMTKQAGRASAKLLITLPFLSYLIAMIVYYVKSPYKEQYAYKV